MPDSAVAAAGPMSKRQFGFKALLMTLWVYPALALWTLSMGSLSPLLILTWKLATGWSVRKCTRHLIWIYGKCWLIIISPFVSVKREQFEHIPTDSPCIMVINHLSFFDTFFFGLLPVYHVNLTLRSWPFKMLWYAGFMRLAGYLDLESSSWDIVLTKSQEEFDDGAYAMFFPEGHRSRDGKMQRFHSGAFKIAIETNTPIVPLCITGSDVLLPPKAKMLMPCTVKMRALEMVQPTGFDGELGHAELRKMIKKRMAAAIKEMRSE